MFEKVGKNGIIGIVLFIVIVIRVLTTIINVESVNSNPLTVVESEPSHIYAMYPNKKTYFFQIGFNKCSTTSICQFFRQNGVPSLHWVSAKIYKTIFANLIGFLQSNGIKNVTDIRLSNISKHALTSGFGEWRKLRTLIETAQRSGRLSPLDWNDSRLLYPLDDEYQYFGDFAGYQFYQWLDQSYRNNDCVFILNFRFVHDWLLSRVRHRINPPSLLRMAAEARNIYTDNDSFDWVATVIEIWYNDWRFHTCDVLRYFMSDEMNTNRRHLVLYDINRDNGTVLAQKLKPWIDLNVAAMPHANAARTHWRPPEFAEAFRVLSETDAYQIRHNYAFQEIEYLCNISFHRMKHPFVLI